MSDGTAVARAPATELPAEAQAGLQQLRTAGTVEVAKQKELNTLARMLEGVQWGNVKGSALSAQTRYGIARICQSYGADPLMHIHVLGGNIYLNGQYWAEQINGLPNLAGWRQENISAGYAEKLRQQARAVMKDAKEFEAPELRDEGLRLLALARTADERRAFFEIPDAAQAAYETIIEFTDSRDPVREANYAPNGSNDPVGKTRPGETARTRSLRRAGAKASPRLRTLDEQAARQEIKAEFRVIQDDDAARFDALPRDGEIPAVLVGAGEPAAARAVDAEPLPVEEIPAPAPAPRAVGNARAERRKFEDGCRVLGVDNVAGFVADHLGHEPGSLEDYLTLNAALAVVEAGGAVLPEHDEPGLGL